MHKFPVYAQQTSKVFLCFCEIVSLNTNAVTAYFVRGKDGLVVLFVISVRLASHGFG